MLAFLFLKRDAKSDRPHRNMRPPPHAIGDDRISGKHKHQSQRRRVIRQHKRCHIHAGMKHHRCQNRPPGSVIEPRQDDGDGNQEHNSKLQVRCQREPARPKVVEWRMPQRPWEPHHHTRQQRRQSSLQTVEQKPPPPRLFQHSNKEDVIQQRHATHGNRERCGSLPMRNDQRQMEQVGDPGRNDQDGWQEQKPDQCPPVGRMHQSFQKVTHTCIFREHSRNNPRWNSRNYKEPRIQVQRDIRSAAPRKMQTEHNPAPQHHYYEQCRSALWPIEQSGFPTPRQDHGRNSRARSPDVQKLLPGMQCSGSNPTDPRQTKCQGKKFPDLPAHRRSL